MPFRLSEWNNSVSNGLFFLNVTFDYISKIRWDIWSLFKYLQVLLWKDWLDAKVGKKVS